MLNRFTISASIFAAGFALIAAHAEPVNKPVKTESDIATQRVEARQALQLAQDIERERVKQLSCLAYTLWGEARSESQLGQEMVATVILNRVDSSKFPDTICGVVHQSKQFSMYNKGDVNGGKAHKAFTSAKPSNEVLMALHVSKKVLRTPKVNRILPKSSLNYHTTSVSPKWNKNLKKYASVDSHIFYTLP